MAILINKYIDKYANKDMSEIISGTFISVILKIVGTGLAYAFIFILSNKFGAEAVGIFSIYQTSLLLLTIVAVFGFNNTILRFAAQYSTTGRWDLLAVIYKRMLKIVVIVSLALAVGVYVAADWLASVFLHTPNYSIVFKAIAFILPCSAITELNTEAIRGLKIISFSELFRTVHTNLLNILLFVSIIALVGFSTSSAIVSYSVALCCTFMFSSMYWVRQIRLRTCDSCEKKEKALTAEGILTVSLPLFVSTLLQYLMTYVPIYFVGIYQSSSDVGIYSAAVRMASVTGFILVAINTIVGPKFAELYWSDKIEDLKEVVKYSSTLIFWFSAPILLGLMLFPDYIMGLLGLEFIRGRWVLLILCFGQFVNALSGSVVYFLAMTGGHNVIRNIMLGTAIVSILLNVVLVKSLGITGAALSTTVSVAFWNIAAVIYIRKRHSINTFYLPGRSISHDPQR